MGGADYSIGLWVCLFLFGVWGGGRLFGACRLPPILGQIFMGIGE